MKFNVLDMSSTSRNQSSTLVGQYRQILIA